MNKFTFTGRIIKEIEYKFTPAGVPITEFLVAVDRKTKNEEGYYNSDIFACKAWRTTAEFVAKYFTKGSKILVTDAAVETESWVDQTSGAKRSKTVIQVREVEFFGDKSSGGGTTATAKSESNAAASDELDDDDTDPFANE